MFPTEEVIKEMNKALEFKFYSGHINVKIPFKNKSLAEVQLLRESLDMDGAEVGKTEYEM